MKSDEDEKTPEELLEELLAEPNVTDNGDGTVTVLLTEPVTYAKHVYESITLRKSRGKDWREASPGKGEFDRTIRLAASVAGVPLRVFDEMDGEDAMLCAGIAGLLGKKSRTGRTSSET